MMDNDDFVLVDENDGEQSDDGATALSPTDLEMIRSWLSPTKFESDGSEYRKHLNSHVAGTGDWLFETEHYKDWHATDSRTGALWIQGIPGSGKSVVAANLIPVLKSENLPVLFFFARRIIKSNSEPRFLVRDCLYQLLDYSVALQRRLKGLVEIHRVVGGVPFSGLWRVLLFGLSTVPKIYLVFDALDELSTEEDEFLKCLADLGGKSPESIKLVMTSRPLPYLQAVLKGSFLTNVRLSGRRIEKDIHTYISHRLACQQERSLTVEERSAIKDVLCQKGHGLFLYARLMLDELLQEDIPVSAQLQHLPSSLEGMYVDLLHEHSIRSGASRRFQQLLLSWITHASRPLRVTELAALIDSIKDHSAVRSTQDAKKMVQTSCGPLLEILDDETVQIIHHSFTEFLLDAKRISANEDTGSTKWFPAFSPAKIHQSLMISCIDYLKSGCFDSWSVEQRQKQFRYANDNHLEKQHHLMIRFQFLQYASQNLLNHAAKCDGTDIDLHHKLDNLMQYGSHDFESWKDFIFSKDDQITTDDFYPLHVASQAGLTAYALWLLDQGADPDLVDSQNRTSTAYAAMFGHAETLTVLLDRNASITVNDWDGLQPIHHAAKGNHVHALRCLLNAGADPTSPKCSEYHDWYEGNPSTLGKTPIQLACEIGNAHATAELLQHLTSSQRSFVLPHWACATGQADVLSVLFQYPEILANINRKDPCGRTALYLAACFADCSTVRILLNNGAGVDLKSEWIEPNSMGEIRVCSTPLQGWAHTNVHRQRLHDAPYSSVDEWEKSAKLLIEAGCDIEARDEKGQTVLFWWTEQLAYGRGHSDRSARFVSLLLQHGANPCATDSEGNTPLHMNLRWQPDTKIIDLFTKAGADINAVRPGDLATPLIVSAKRQCTGVKAFIESKADFNMQDSDGNTALHHICRSWLLELKEIEEWLTVADPTIKNRKGETCLYNLRWGNGGDGRVEAIALFKAKGLDIESRNRSGKTALLSFCEKAEPRFIIGMMRYGANAKSKDYQNKSCLHLAAHPLSNHDHGKQDLQTATSVMSHLINAGANINNVDFDGNTPFLDAIGLGDHFSALKITLQVITSLGGRANAINNHGETALHKAAASSTTAPELVDFLLQSDLGIDLHARDNEGVMALHTAASTSAVTTSRLVQAGADIHAKTYDYRTPLHFAAEAAQSNVLGFLCKLYKDKSCTVDQVDETGQTALHYASRSGSSECVYHLLEAGANPNAEDLQGLTPLHSISEHQIDTGKLRKRRKYENFPLWRNMPPGLAKLYSYMDTTRGTPFHKINWNVSVAICQEEEAQMIEDVARLLLSAGANPALCDKSGQTPHDVAIFLNNGTVADILSSFQTRTDTSNAVEHQWYSLRSSSAEEIVRKINVETADAYTLFQTAVALRNTALLDALLKSGFDPTARGPESLSAVHTIAYFGLISMMKIVASHVEDLNMFYPPLLHVAASRESSNVQMIDLLIKLGVNVDKSYQEVDDNSRRSTGEPVHFYAAAHILAAGEQWWNAVALEFLCKAGVNLEPADSEGNSVLQCSLTGRRSGSRGLGFWRDETLEVSLKYGANVNAISPEDGATPLIAALNSRRCHKTIQKLLDAGTDITLGRAPAIYEAIESEDLEVVAAILDAGADTNTLYRPETPRRYGRGPKEETPLLSASLEAEFSMGLIGLLLTKEERRCAREEIMSLLLKRGADPLQGLQGGKTTVLHEIACNHGNVGPIIKAGVNLEVLDSQSRTPLLSACSLTDHFIREAGHDFHSTSMALILAGANIHAIDSTGFTALHLAVQSDLFETASLLLEKGAMASALNNASLAPLYYALSLHYEAQLKFATLLLSAGADPLMVGLNGETPLHLLAPSIMSASPSDGAEFRERVYQFEDKTNYLAKLLSLYERFVEGGCDRNARDRFGNTPLFPYVKLAKHGSDDSYYCTEQPAEKDLKKIFDSHDVLAVNDEGDTLLHAVASREEDSQSEPTGVWIFKELMVRGVDPRQENKKRVSALDVAAACGKEGILGLFAREE